MKPLAPSIALVLVALSARSAGAQGSSTCGDRRVAVSAPLVGTAGVVARWGPRGSGLSASADGRVEALAAGGQCASPDDGTLALRTQSALTRDLPSPARQRREPFARQPRGVFARGRVTSRFEPATGRHAAAYDLAVGAWRDLGPFSITATMQDVEAPAVLARVARRSPQGNSLQCDTGCVGTPSPSPSSGGLLPADSAGGSLLVQRARELVLSAATWRHGVALSVSAGAGLPTAGDGPRRWATGEAVLPVRDRIDVVMLARLSSRQVSPSRGEIAALLRYHAGKVSVETRDDATAAAPRAAPSAFRAEPTGRRDVYRLVIRAADASAVRLRADFTGWRPVPLERGRDGEWVVEIAVAAGWHQLLVSVDGDEWHAPPGLPVAPDGFGFSVGVVQIGI